MADKSTVTVGCKLPHGIHLDLYEVIGDQPTVKSRVTVKGQNAAEVIGGHGITMGVDKAHFDEWMRVNKNHPAVVNGLLFAHESAQKTVGEAQEKKDTKSGFEGIDPEKPGMGVQKLDTKS